MAKATSRRRHYPGEVEARFLVPCLNDGSEAEKAAIQEIVLTLKTLEKVTPLTPRGFIEKDESLSTQMERVNSLNKILRPYSAIPFVGIKAARLKVGWRRTGDGPVRRKPAIGISDLDAVMIALQLAEDGLLCKIRQCECCGAWYFRKFSHGRWCSDGCKSDHYSTEPEKLKHAKAERENRPHRIKSRKTKSRKSAVRS